jgi:hypothetical protein
MAGPRNWSGSNGNNEYLIIRKYHIKMFQTKASHLEHKPTHSMEKTSVQEIVVAYLFKDSRILMNPEVYYGAHNCPTLDPVPKQTKPFHPPTLLYKVNFVS